MKTIPAILIAIFLLCLTACDHEDPNTELNPGISSISLTGCLTDGKSTEPEIPSIRLSYHSGDSLSVSLLNTEFCCGTELISVDNQISGDEISLTITDQGPHTFCYCPHSLEFVFGPLELKNYNLTFIESEHSYSRDTFLINFDFSEQLDITVSGDNPGNMISSNPVQYSETVLSGCNTGMKSNKMDSIPANDTVVFFELADTLRIFVGLNLTCCKYFSSESWIDKDTLVMKINTLQDDQCDCICYYTFDYYYSDYSGQAFYYQFYIDDYQRFEGTYNLP